MVRSLHFLSEKYPFCNHPVLIGQSSVARFSNIFKHLITYLSTSNVLLTYMFFTGILHIFHVFPAYIEGVTLHGTFILFFFILSCPCISLIYKKYSIFNILYILIRYINILYIIWMNLQQLMGEPDPSSISISLSKIIPLTCTS